MMKKIAILFEKSNKIGSGHYFRSLRLKNLLKDKFKVTLFHIKNKKNIATIIKKNYDLHILDLKTYRRINTTKKIIIFENLGKPIPNTISINPLDLNLENSGPEFFIFPKNIEKIKFSPNYSSLDQKITILIIQGANDSNDQLNKLLNYLDTNKKKIKFNFELIIKLLKKKKIKNIKNSVQTYNIKDITKIFKQTDIAISSVGNTSYELGYIGIPTIHYTIEKREKIRAAQLERLKLAKFIKKDMSIIINELNKIYYNDKYRKKLIQRRKFFFRKKNKLIKLINNEL